MLFGKKLGRHNHEQKQQHRQRNPDGENADGFCALVFAAQNMKQPDKQIDGDKTEQQDGNDSQHGAILPQPPPPRRIFRPHPVLTVAAIVIMLATARLAAWQFDRAAQKAALENAARAGLAAAPVQIGGDAELRPYLRAVARGVYLPEREILIDNRVRQKIAGVHVITPLLLEGGGVIAVNRGWAQKNTAPPPPPSGQNAVRGVLQKDGANAYTLSEKTESGNVWQNLDLQKYAANTGLPLLTLVLFAENAGALPAAKVRVDFKSARSTGYAWQWISLCVLTFAFYLILGFKRRASAPFSRAAKNKTAARASAMHDENEKTLK